MGCHEKFYYIRTPDVRKYYYGVVIRKLLYTRRDRTRRADAGAAQRARRRATATSPGSGNRTGDYTAARNTISGFAGPEVVFYALP